MRTPLHAILEQYNDSLCNTVMNALYTQHTKKSLLQYLTLSFPGERCVLRPIQNTEEEIETIARLANDPFIYGKRLYRKKDGYDQNDAAYFVKNLVHKARENDDKLCMGIEYEGNLAGQVSVSRNTLKDNTSYANTAFVGMWIGAPYRGKGLSADALKTLCDNVLPQMPDLTRIEARILTGKHIMPKILTKAGFQHEATLKQRVKFKEKIRDEHMYVRLIDIDPDRKA